MKTNLCSILNFEIDITVFLRSYFAKSFLPYSILSKYKIFFKTEKNEIITDLGEWVSYISSKEQSISDAYIGFPDSNIKFNKEYFSAEDVMFENEIIPSIVIQSFHWSFCWKVESFKNKENTFVMKEMFTVSHKPKTEEEFIKVPDKLSQLSTETKELTDINFPVIYSKNDLKSYKKMQTIPLQSLTKQNYKLYFETLCMILNHTECKPAYGAFNFHSRALLAVLYVKNGCVDRRKIRPFIKGIDEILKRAVVSINNFFLILDSTTENDKKASPLVNNSKIYIHFNPLSINAYNGLAQRDSTYPEIKSFSVINYEQLINLAKLNTVIQNLRFCFLSPDYTVEPYEISADDLLQLHNEKLLRKSVFSTEDIEYVKSLPPQEEFYLDESTLYFKDIEKEYKKEAVKFQIWNKVLNIDIESSFGDMYTFNHFDRFIHPSLFADCSISEVIKNYTELSEQGDPYASYILTLYYKKMFSLFDKYKCELKTQYFENYRKFLSIAVNADYKPALLIEVLEDDNSVNEELTKKNLKAAIESGYAPAELFYFRYTITDFVNTLTKKSNKDETYKKAEEIENQILSFIKTNIPDTNDVNTNNNFLLLSTAYDSIVKLYFDIFTKFNSINYDLLFNDKSLNYAFKSSSIYNAPNSTLTLSQFAYSSIYLVNYPSNYMEVLAKQEKAKQAIDLFISELGRRSFFEETICLPTWLKKEQNNDPEIFMNLFSYYHQHSISDIKKAHYYLTKAIELNYPPAILEFALLYEMYTWPFYQDEKLAKKCAKVLHVRKLKTSSYSGKPLLNPTDEEGIKTRDELKAKADAGDASAQLKYAKEYLFSLSEEQFHYISLSAEQNNAEALEKLAQFYESDCCIPKDVYKAFHLYLKSSYLSRAHGTVALTKFYREGIAVVKDEIEAKKWKCLYTLLKHHVHSLDEIPIY